jgi:protein TonB
MLAYAVNRPVPAKRQSSPNALLVVISVHVALLAVVMSAKMDLPGRLDPGPKLIKIPITPPPRPIRTADPRPAPHPIDNNWDNPQPNVPVQLPNNPTVDPEPVRVDPGPIAGAGTAIFPMLPNTVTAPVRHDARLLTPASELKPPYPTSKLLSEEEAVLRLKLTIDGNGRVVAVDPVGAADKAFLEAARRHLTAHWRYQPATEDGRSVASSMVITLRFQLDG